MKAPFPILIIAAALLQTTAAAAQTSQQTFAVDGEALVKIQILQGNVVVRGWDRSGSVVVRATSQDAKIQPRVEQKGNAIVVGEFRVNPAFFCGAQSGSINYELFVPFGAAVSAVVMTGNFTAERLSGKLDVKCVTGFVSLQLDAPISVNAECVNGKVECRVTRSDPVELNLKNISGPVFLALPKGVNSKLKAESMSGALNLRPDVKVLKRHNMFGLNRVQGTLGSGAGTISIFTVSGDITVK